MEKSPALSMEFYLTLRKTRNIEPDPVKSKIIKRAFKEYSEGQHGLESLSEKLFLWGITSRSGKRVGYHTINRILSNPIYIGLIVINGETYQGSFKPIVSKGLFDRVQKVLAERSKPRKRKHKHDFPFLGLLICGECGASITAQHAKGNGGMYRYYRCTKKLNPCSQKYLREDLIISQLKEKLQGVTLSKSDADKMLTQVAKWKKTEDLSATALVQQLDENIKKTELKLDKLVNTFLDGNIDKNMYLAKKDDLLHKKTAMIEKRTSFLEKGNNWLEPLKEWILKASSVDELVSSKNYNEISEFFKKIGTNRRLLDKRVEMDLKMPWNILLFSDETLKKTYHDSVRSTRENFCEKRALPVWWR